MPTLDWLNRAHAFTIAAEVPYRLLHTVSSHGDAQAAADYLLIEGEPRARAWSNSLMRY